MMKLSTLGLAVALLYGCGGGNSTLGNDGTLAQASPVQVTETASALRVSASVSPSASMPSVVMQQSQYSFAATLSAGPDAGRNIAGTLLLKADAEDGVTEVEGVLIPLTSTTTTSVATPLPDALAQASALQDQLARGLEALRAAYRSDVEALSQTLRTAMAAGTATTGDKKALTPAQQAAVQQFKDAFTARTAQYHSDTAALTLDVQGQIAALGVAPASDGSRSGGEDRRRTGVYQAKGTISADGKVDLVLTDRTRSSIRLLGQVASDGSMTGALTGPAAGDQGTWTASTGSPLPPPPPPPPPPVGNVANGLVRYTANCASCHTANVKSNVLNVTNASTVTGLNAAIAKVNAMSFLGTVLTAQDKLDIAAYINSAK